jgi:hypothetical protein
MSRRVEMAIFAALLVILGFVLYRALRPGGVTVAGVFAADPQFRPLDVQEPQLHLDLLEDIRKIGYSGTHRNIFAGSAAASATASTRAVLRLCLGTQ